jgi:hypothetical protein
MADRVFAGELEDVGGRSLLGKFDLLHGGFRIFGAERATGADIKAAAPAKTDDQT